MFHNLPTGNYRSLQGSVVRSIMSASEVDAAIPYLFARVYPAHAKASFPLRISENIPQAISEPTENDRLMLFTDRSNSSESLNAYMVTRK